MHQFLKKKEKLHSKGRKQNGNLTGSTKSMQKKSLKLKQNIQIKRTKNLKMIL